MAREASSAAPVGARAGTRTGRRVVRADAASDPRKRQKRRHKRFRILNRRSRVHLGSRAVCGGSRVRFSAKRRRHARPPFAPGPLPPGDHAGWRGRRRRSRRLTRRRRRGNPARRPMPRPSSPPFLGRTWSRGLWRRFTRGARGTLGGPPVARAGRCRLGGPRGVSRGIERGRDADARARPRTRVCRGRRPGAPNARGRRRGRRRRGAGWATPRTTSPRTRARTTRTRRETSTGTMRTTRTTAKIAWTARGDEREGLRSRRYGGGRLRRCAGRDARVGGFENATTAAEVRAARRGPRTPPARSRRPFEAPRRFEGAVLQRARGDAREGPIRPRRRIGATTKKPTRRTTTTPPATAPRFRETREETR